MQSEGVVDPTHRRVINANFDTTNVVSFKEMEDKIIHTLETCISFLKDHCGPRSGYAMLIDDTETINFNFKPSQFTRDGIRILQGIEMMSPLERYIKDVLTYVGMRVDDVAKDGTTSSMLFAAIFLKRMMQSKATLQCHSIPLTTANKIIRDLFQDVIDDFQKNIFTVEKLAGSDQSVENIISTAGDIAFMQALSSSGGDMELACAMREIFRHSPPETWEAMSYYRSNKESTDRFIVEVDEFDSKIRCISASSRALNKAFGTEYQEDHAQVIIYPDAMMQNDFKASSVIQYLDTVPSDQPVVLVTSMLDGMFTSRVESLNNKRTKPITVWQFSPETVIAGQNYPWELMVAIAKAGATPVTINNSDGFDPEKHAFYANVHWKDTYLLITQGVQDEILHRFYTHPEEATDFYKDCITEVKRILQDYREGHYPDGRLYGHFLTVLNDLITVKRPRLRIGGPIHEQISLEDVVKDVQGAIMSSLNNGFVINGCGDILKATVNISAWMKDNTPETRYNMYKAEIHKILLQSLMDVMSIICDTENLPNIVVDPTIDRKRFFNLMFFIPGNLDNYMNDIPTIIQSYPHDLAAGMNYPVVQPMKVATEMFKRVQELVVKVTNANKAVIYGGVVLKEDDLADRKSS